jgi:hypothetical protein
MENTTSESIYFFDTKKTTTLIKREAAKKNSKINKSILGVKNIFYFPISLKKLKSTPASFFFYTTQSEKC